MKLIKLLSFSLAGFVLLASASCGDGGGASSGGSEADSPASHINTFVGDYDGTEVFIPADSANKMISSYLESVNSGTTNDSSLHSLIFDADSMRAYLNNTSIKHVKVMFAHTLEYINAKGAGNNVAYERGALTVVFGGYDAQGNYVFWQGNRIPNHGSPCPSDCVTDGTASSDLFPVNP